MMFAGIVGNQVIGSRIVGRGEGEIEGHDLVHRVGGLTASAIVETKTGGRESSGKGFALFVRNMVI